MQLIFAGGWDYPGRRACAPIVLPVIPHYAGWQLSKISPDNKNNLEKLFTFLRTFLSFQDD
jgi:hypothetical protein